MKQIKLVFSILFLFSLTISVNAQDTSYYSSKFEKTIFEQIKDSVDVAPLNIMIALSYEEGNENTIPNSIKSTVNKLKNKGISSKKTKKKINEIYKLVHSEMLKKYIIDADFKQLFETGEYNCVSATALYAFILDDFDISYEIKETPTHVYLIADPKSAKVLVESTLPQNGTIVFDYKAKKEYVNYLLSNKLISQEEYDNTSIEQLFDENFDDNKVINTTQLAALLYYNKGVEAYNTSKFNEASNYLSKAFLIYPSTTIRYLYNSALSNQLNSEITTKKFNPITLSNFLNLNRKNDEFSGLGLDYFKNIGNELIVNQGNSPAYQHYYSQFNKNLSDSVKTDEYDQIYYYVLAYSHYMNRKYDQALNELGFAYKANQENLDIKNLIQNAANDHLITDRNHAQTIDSLDHYFKMFPFLAENKGFQEYYSYCHMRGVRENYVYGNSAKGKELLGIFENFLDSKPDFFFDENYLGEMYSDVAFSYGKKGQMTNATNALKKGLQYAPKSLILNERLKSFKAYRTEMANIKTQVVEASLSREEQFKADIDKYFIACWEMTGMLDGDMNPVKTEKKLMIMSYKNNKLSYKIDGKLESGKYSIRNKSRLLYLIPNRDKDDYVLYKIETINSYEMVLRPFEDGKMSRNRIYLNKCD